MMLKVLINNFNPKASNALVKFLPQAEQGYVSNWDIGSDDIKPILFHPQQVVRRLHHSWLKPLVEKFPEKLWPTISSALEPEQAQGLQMTMCFQPSSDSVSPPVKSFIINQLFRLLGTENLLPQEYLNPTEFFPLLDWNKKKVVSLIDYLGLHDLASEMRRIVNKKYLENFTSCLTSKQLYYLKICLYQKEKLVSPPLEINPAERDCSRLKTVLHQRGLVRFSKALSGQHRDFVWYLAHTLDRGRGKIILSSYQAEAVPDVTPLLKSQVLNLMNFFTKGE